MPLKPTGINNHIVEWRAKDRRVDVWVNDASGAFTADGYTAYLYAKKYPIRADAPIDVSVEGYIISGNKISFDLYPFITDLQDGDYVYEVYLVQYEKEITIIQDKLTILKSLNTDYYTVGVSIEPSSHLFTIHDTSLNLNLISGDTHWEAENVPTWLTLTPEEANVDSSLSAYSGTLSIENATITFRNAYNKTCTFDASLIYIDLDIITSITTFNPYNYSKTFDISTGDINNWRATIPNWLTPDVSYGNGNATITISCPSIKSFETDSSLIVDSSYSYQQSFDVSYYYHTDIEYDASGTLVLIGSDYEKGYDVSTSSVNEWYISYIPNWLDIDTSSGLGNSPFNLSVDNTVRYAGVSYSEEVITINSTYADDTSIGVSYYAPTLTVGPSEYGFNNTDRTIKVIAISTSDQWNTWTLTLPSWLSASSLSGTGDASVTLTVSGLIGKGTYDVSITSYAGTQSIMDVSLYIDVADPCAYYLFDNNNADSRGAYNNMTATRVGTAIGTAGYDNDADRGTVIEYLNEPDNYNDVIGYSYQATFSYNYSNLNLDLYGDQSADPYSISLWFKTNSNTTDKMTLFSNHGGASYSRGVDINIFPTKLLVRRFLWESDTQIVAHDIPGDYRDNEWHNVIYTFANNQSHFYLDGVKEWDSSVMSIDMASTETYLACEYYLPSYSGSGNPAARWPYRGLIDDFASWDFKLTDYQAEAWYYKNI